MDEDIFFRDLLSSTSSPVVDDTPTELTLEDLDKSIEMIMRGPRLCSCGNGFPATYEVTSPGRVYDLMCVRCFQDLTKDGNVFWVGG